MVLMKLKYMKELIDTEDKNLESPIANEIVSRWDHEGTPREFRSSANYVFVFKMSGKKYFLRFTYPYERSIEEIKAELDFMDYLSNNDIRVVKPIKSLSGKYIETVDTSIGQFNAVVFEELKGKRFEVKDLDGSKFYSWGESLGKLHNASKGYDTKHRKSWRDHMEMVARVLPKEEKLAQKELATITDWVDKLPVNEDNFGLIHFDFELDNLFWNGNEISIIDFDDCAYYWFVADIAFALRDLFDKGVDLNNENFVLFMKGYRAEMPIDKEILEDLPFFIRMHNLIIFAKFLRTLEGSNPDDDPKWLVPLRKKLDMYIGEYRKRFATYYN